MKDKGKRRSGSHDTQYNTQVSVGETGIGSEQGPTSHATGAVSSMLSRTTASAWALTRNMLDITVGPLQPSELDILQNSMEKGESSSGRSSYGDDIAGSISSKSSRGGSITGPSNLSLRDASPSLSPGSSEAEADYQSFLEPAGNVEWRQDHHNWIADYSGSRAPCADCSHQDGAEVVSLLNDPGFVPLESPTKDEQCISLGPEEALLISMPDSQAPYQEFGNEAMVSSPGHLFTPPSQDGREVISLLEDPEFSPLFDTSTDIGDDTVATDLLIPSSAKLVLDDLKLSLPTPPAHRALSATNPLNLCFSCFTTPIPDEVNDQWLEVNRRYMEEVWLDEDIPGSQPLAEATEQGRGDGHAGDLGQYKAKAVERLRLTLAHLSLPLPSS